MRPLGVFLASADKAELAALRLLFKQLEDVCVVGAANDTHGVLSLILNSGADFLLLDWELPIQSDLSSQNGEGEPELAVPDLIAILNLAIENLHTIVLSIDLQIETVALAAGADDFVCKSSPPERMLAALVREIRNQQMNLFHA